MSKFSNWYKEDPPLGAMSNKQVFWFAVISWVAIIISIIQEQ